MMVTKLAWRNIWRNKRRTAITMASIFFAVLFSIFMNSLQKGAWVRMLDNVVNFYYGYGQIHQKDYWEDKSINKAFVMDEELMALPKEIDGLEGLTPRLESFALASSKDQTSGMLIVGTDPDRENNLTKLKSRLVEGNYFGKNDLSVIIAEGVGKLLKVGLGDTLILISQGYHGVNAAGKYPIKGIVKFASPDLNKKMIYLPLLEAQSFFGADNMITSLGMKISNRNELPKVINGLRKKLDPGKYEIMDWKTMLPELLEAQKTDAAGNYIFLLVLYAIITFGIFGTVLMMVKEREFEFGVLLSIGMKRRLLAISVWGETVFLGLLGALLGILGSLPLVYYFHTHPLDLSKFQGGEEVAQAYEKWGFDPIFPTVVELPIFLWQAVIVVILTSILATYAMWRIKRLTPVEAMRR